MFRCRYVIIDCVWIVDLCVMIDRAYCFLGRNAVWGVMLLGA